MPGRMGSLLTKGSHLEANKQRNKESTARNNKSMPRLYIPAHGGLPGCLSINSIIVFNTFIQKTNYHSTSLLSCTLQPLFNSDLVQTLLKTNRKKPRFSRQPINQNARHFSYSNGTDPRLDGGGRSPAPEQRAPGRRPLVAAAGDGDGERGGLRAPGRRGGARAPRREPRRHLVGAQLRLRHVRDGEAGLRQHDGGPRPAGGARQGGHEGRDGRRGRQDPRPRAARARARVRSQVGRP